MKAIAELTVSICDANEIIVKTIQRMVETTQWNNLEAVEYRNSNCRFIDFNLNFGIWNQNDSWGAAFGYEVSDGAIRFFGQTCGNNTHELRFERSDSEVLITAVHDGRRGSTGSIMFDYLPQKWWNDVRDRPEWRLVSCQSSRPEWAVEIAVLNRRFGEGVAYLCEEEYISDNQLRDEIDQKLIAAGRMPLDWSWNYVSDGVVYTRDNEPITNWAWTGVEYRRARANGVAL